MSYVSTGIDLCVHYHAAIRATSTQSSNFAIIKQVTVIMTLGVLMIH